MSKHLLVFVSLIMLFALGATALVAQDATATEEAVETVAEAVPAASSGLVVGLWHLHSAVRWLVVVVTVVLLVKLLIGLMGDGAFDGLTRTLLRVFTISISLQWLIGVIFFLIFGGFDVRYRWEHAIIMTVAVAVGSMTNRWKDAPDRTRYRNSLIMVLIALVLVYIGVALLPQGWRLMPTT